MSLFHRAFKYLRTLNIVRSLVRRQIMCNVHKYYKIFKNDSVRLRFGYGFYINFHLLMFSTVFLFLRQFSRRFQDAGPAPMTPYKGHLHIVVNREFVQFAVHDARARKLFDWANNTRIPDEIFFSTLNRNPTLQIPGSYKYKGLAFYTLFQSFGAN